MEALAATLFGAVLGLVGSLYVARREMRRSFRISLYHELIPKLAVPEPRVMTWETGHGLFFGIDATRPEQMAELRRIALLAGGRAFALAARFEEAHNRLTRPATKEEEAFIFGDDREFQPSWNERARQVRSEEWRAALEARAALYAFAVDSVFGRVRPVFDRRHRRLRELERRRLTLPDGTAPHG